MTQSGETQSDSRRQDTVLRALEAVIKQQIEDFEGAVTAAMRESFTETLKSLKRGRVPKHSMLTVTEGVLEKLPSGDYDASLHTDQGHVFLRGTQRNRHESTDPQVIDSPSVVPTNPRGESIAVAPAALLAQLKDAGAQPSPALICAVELTRFDAAQREELLPLLWQFIIDHRDSNDRAKLIAVAAAVRKYIAMMPMSRMGDLARLLETGTRSPLPIELEIEIAKMVFRNFEVHPPISVDPYPELAKLLWEMAQAYINPRLLPRDKYAAAASLAIDAVVAMRSALAAQALSEAAACEYRWFAEIVSDDLDRLREKWIAKSPEAAAWLEQLKASTLANV